MSGGGWGRGAGIITRASLSAWIRTAKKILSSHIGTHALEELGDGGRRVHTDRPGRNVVTNQSGRFYRYSLVHFHNHKATILCFLYFRCMAALYKTGTAAAIRLEKKKGLRCRCVCAQGRPLSVWLLGKTWPHDLTWLLRFLNCGRLLYFCQAAFHIQQKNLTREEI